jgi:argininosuccinate lyase
MKNGYNLENLPLKEYKKFSLLFEEDIYEAVNLENCAFARIAI